MKKSIIIWAVGILLPFCTNAQLGKQMSKYHEKKGVTVTQLDKSLYGLYQRENLSPELQDMLQRLDEVNILNLNLQNGNPDTGNKIIAQFRNILDNPDKYRLVKSKNDGHGKQLVYIRNKNGKTTDLAVWKQTPEQVDIIELRGDIQLDRIASLSRALNLSSLRSLSALSSRQEAEEETDVDEEMRRAMEVMQNMYHHFGNMFNDLFDRRHTQDSTDKDFGFFHLPEGMDSMNELFDNTAPEQFREWMDNNGNFRKMEKFFQSFGNGEDFSSNSVEITEENGKTKLKINSTNSDITYIIDGKEAPKDNIQMPEKIRNVNIIPSREDARKSYLFIISQDKLGSFSSYRDGMLTFQYDRQEYKYNIENSQEPLLVIDGRLSSSFDIDPSRILQIRPVSQIEKEAGYYPKAEVMINTK